MPASAGSGNCLGVIFGDVDRITVLSRGALGISDLGRIVFACCADHKTLRSSLMKQLRFPIVILTTFCLFLITATQSRAADGGRLIIKRSPTLGSNVTLTIWIDGKLIGPVVRGSTFDRPISAGHHMLLVQPNRSRGDWRQELDVRPGQTHAYMATYNVEKIALYPTSPHY